MLMNSLAALAMGYVLDMMFGDLKAAAYPLNLIRVLSRKLSAALKKAYSDTAEAQRVAGMMFSLLMILIVGGGCALILLVCYNIFSLLGVVAEGIMCWSAISSKSLKLSAGAVMRCVRNGNISAAQKKLKEISECDADSQDSDGIIKCAVEAVAEKSVTMVIAPIFWSAVFGGVGGLLCRCISIMDSPNGTKTKAQKNFGSVPGKINDALLYIPARIGAVLMKLDGAFLKLDTENASRVYRRDKNKSSRRSAGHIKAMYAGLLDITLGGSEPYKGRIIRRPLFGANKKTYSPMNIYWAEQLLMGSAFIGIVITAVVRVILYIVL